MDWIQQWQSKLNKQNGVAPLVRTGGSRHTGLAALPHRNIHGGFIMADKRAPGRSLDEWMKLVTECRQSGLTDAAWCTEHGISPSSFYNAVTRLRKRACQIPDPVGKANTLDFT